MKMYITMGQNHIHDIDGEIIDKDSVAVIECDDYAHGRYIAEEHFGDKFCFTYTDKTFDHSSMKYFPRGLIYI